MSDFGQLVEAEIPRLRRYAGALTRDIVNADDLVQACFARAVAKQHLCHPGTICAPGSLRSSTTSMSTKSGVDALRGQGADRRDGADVAD